MPHFKIDCAERILTEHKPSEIMAEVYEAALASKLFDSHEIKVRINPFQYYNVANSKSNFLHVFAYIMQGRTTAQKADLSRRIVSRLKEMFPEVPVISINIMDFEKATYCNKTMI